MKIAIKLNILNKNVVFKDIFEWDILNPLNDAGEFAQLLGDELELDPELVKNIEFGILEQEQSYLRMLMLQGINANKGEVTNDVLKMCSSQAACYTMRMGRTWTFSETFWKQRHSVLH